MERAWVGTNGFRMYPADPFDTRPSTADFREVAGGVGWLLAYTWTHSTDGDQSGTLLVGSADDSGTVTAAWLDSWHQKPGVVLLSGTVTAGRVELEYDYGGGWLWRVAAGRDGDTLAMTMVNVVPEGHPGAEPGPYDVMRARWTV